MIFVLTPLATFLGRLPLSSDEELLLEELPEEEELEELRLEPLDEPLEELEPDLELDEEPLLEEVVFLLLRLSLPRSFRTGFDFAFLGLGLLFLRALSTTIFSFPFIFSFALTSRTIFFIC